MKLSVVLNEINHNNVEMKTFFLLVFPQISDSNKSYKKWFSFLHISEQDVLPDKDADVSILTPNISLEKNQNFKIFGILHCKFLYFLK